jgi:hypothetical protein
MLVQFKDADPGGRASKAHVDWEFESRRGHWCLSLVSVVCGQVEVSATGQSLVQRSPTVCGVCVCRWVWSGATIILYTYNE